MSTTITPLTFEEFLDAYGSSVWFRIAKYTQNHHGGGDCPMGRPYLLGGAGGCDPCESLYTDTLLQLGRRHCWSYPESASAANRAT
jgi:hypothetical protein